MVMCDGEITVLVVHYMVDAYRFLFLLSMVRELQWWTMVLRVVLKYIMVSLVRQFVLVIVPVVWLATITTQKIQAARKFICFVHGWYFKYIAV